ncbi:conserved Plasmodium protein, unknown function [Plasmodium sp. DRC-Itaito]|nr:conserved Plasmodium protein, unknown function [Plasmodium sp. DRC-Itaito]
MESCDDDIRIRNKKRKTKKLKNVKESLSLYESNHKKDILSIKNKKLLKNKKNKKNKMVIKIKKDNDDSSIVKRMMKNITISSDDKYQEDITNLNIKKKTKKSKISKKLKNSKKDIMVKKNKKKKKKNNKNDNNYVNALVDEDEIITDNEERIMERIENDHVSYINDKNDEEYSSVNFMKFLENSNDKEKELNKNKNKKKKKKLSHDNNNNNNNNNIHYGDDDDDHHVDDDDDVHDSYQYYSLKDDMYKLNKENKEKIELTDLIYSNDNFFGQGLQKDLNFLENEQNKKKGKKHLSFIEEQKFNTTLGYVQNVKLLNKMNKAYNIIQNSSKVEFGRQKEKKGNQGDEFLNKKLIKRFLKRKEKIQSEIYDDDDNNNKNNVENNNNNDDNIIHNNNNNMLEMHMVDKSHLNNYDEQTNVYNQNKEKIIKRDHKNEEEFNIYNFEEEMKMNLIKSKMLHISEDLLRTEKEKKREEIKKIAQLKLLLSIENRKNRYRKKIKSKSYRKYLRIKEKKEEGKIMKKLYNEHPDMIKDIINYEKEYAEKRNLINNIKKKKTIKTLNRYKNEQLRKEILKSIQNDKEEKNMLKKIIEKTVLNEQTNEDNNIIHDDDIMSEDSDEISSNDDDQINHSDTYSNENIKNHDDMDDKKRKNKIYDEFKKRNLLRFSFVRNAEENKQNEEKYNRRKDILKKFENKNKNKNKNKNNMDNIYDDDDDEEDNSLASFSSDELVKNDEESHILFSKNKLSDFSHKELLKAKKELKNDIDFLNSLKKTNILHIDDVKDDVRDDVNDDVNDINDDVNNVINDDVNDDVNDHINNHINNHINGDVMNDSISADSHLSPSEYKKNDVKDKEDIKGSSKTKKKKSENNRTTTINNNNNNNNLDGEGGGKRKNNKVIENSLKNINKVNNEEILESYCEKMNVYNFENNVYEDYINPKNDDIKEDEELYELSDDEKIKDIEVNNKEWCNYNTLLELEKNKIMKEKEIIENKKNKPLHTITLYNKKDKKFDKYYVDKIPYPYDKHGYEKTLNININKEINDLSAYKQLITPQYSNKVGNVISPLVKNPFELANIFTLKRKNQKSKL